MLKYESEQYIKQLDNKGTCSYTQPDSLVEGCVNGIKDSKQNPGLLLWEGGTTTIAGSLRGPAAAIGVAGGAVITNCGIGALNTAVANCKATYKPFEAPLTSNSNDSTSGIADIPETNLDPLKPVEPVNLNLIGGATNNTPGSGLLDLSNNNSNLITPTLNLDSLKPIDQSVIGLSGYTTPDLQ